MAISDKTITNDDLNDKLIDTLPLKPDLSGDDLQARFDALGLLIRDRFNDLLVELLATTAAAQIGAILLDTGSGETVGEQLQYLLDQINTVRDSAIQGIVPEGSITDKKLSKATDDLFTRFADHVTDIVDNPAHAAKFAAVGTALNGKADLSHTHTTANVTGLDTALSGKAAASHTHTTANVTGLDTALAGKSATTHTHAASGITSGTLALARIPTGTTSATVALGNHIHTTRSYLAVTDDLGANAKGIANMIYNNGSAPAASSCPIGTLYIKFT